MPVLRELTVVELKLFVREPLNVVLIFALPAVWLLVLAGVFGNTPSPQVYRGVGPATYYVAAYIGLVLATTGLIVIPARIAGYRERGVLRRFRASSIPAAAVLGSQVLVGLLVSVVAAVEVTLLSRYGFGAALAVSWPEVILAFVISALAFSAVGVFLGAIMPSSRSAQGVGILLWFVFLMLGGSGPPPEVLTGGLHVAQVLIPQWHVTLALQDPWLGLGMNWPELAVAATMLIVCGVLGARMLRWQ